MPENEFYDCSYDNETMQHLKKVELDILKDVINICNDYNIHYHLHAGSILGAIRHEGFIPWDDEIDIGMFRKDYEKFLKIITNNYNHKYYIINWKTDFNIKTDVYTPQSFLCLRNTKIYGMENKGIYIDIAVMDPFPKNPIKQYLFTKFLKFIHFMIYIFHTVNGEDFTTDFRKNMAKIIKGILKFTHISPKLILKIYSKIFSEQDITKYSYVCNSSFYYDKPLPMDAFREYKTIKFESLNVTIPKNYEIILINYYGDYMKLPPIHKRKDHNFNPIDFGEY